jgi:hypothetical protein
MGVARGYRLKVERSSERIGDNTFQPVLLAKCDECDKQATVTINKRANDLPDAMIVKKFHQQGWTVDRHHALCPTHNGKPRRSNDNEVPIRTTPLPTYPFHTPAEFEAYQLRGQTFGVAPLPDTILTELATITVQEPAMAETARLADLADIRKPDRETKRKIVDAIGGVWDDSRGRYLANNSDELIARDLKVPRAWVEEVRVDLFGDNGGNLEMDEYAAILDERLKAVEKLYTEAIQLAEKYGKIVDEMKGLRTRLARIETQVLPRR